MDFKKEVDFYILICGEQIPGKGEDSYLMDRSFANGAFLGVFDGCGGSGARIYPEYNGRTGAYVASRVCALAVKTWLHDERFRRADTMENTLKRALQKCKEKVGSENLLHGSIIKDFPTTMSAMYVEGDSQQEEIVNISLFNAGDSRCYLLSASGLSQLTADDLTCRDAFQAIYDSAPMTNVLSAAEDCTLSMRQEMIRIPCILFAATDGCYDYLHSPMEFEKLLLSTMQEAKNPAEWESLLEAEIRSVAGDDYTMVLAAIGFGSFEAMKKQYRPRLEILRNRYDPAETDVEALRAQWEIYRKEYEKYQVLERDAG